MSHTPGPWEFKEEEGSVRDNRVIVTADGVCLMSDESYYPWNPDRDDDWQLISAAPDLLEALQTILAAIEGNHVTEGDLNQARTAIDKAMGEQA